MDIERNRFASIAKQTREFRDSVASHQAALEAAEEMKVAAKAGGDGMSIGKAGMMSIANQTIFQPVGKMIGKVEHKIVNGIDGFLGIKTPEEKAAAAENVSEMKTLTGSTGQVTTASYIDRRYYNVFDQTYQVAEVDTQTTISLSTIGLKAPPEKKMYRYVHNHPLLKVTLIGINGAGTMRIIQGPDNEIPIQIDYALTDPLIVSTQQPLEFQPEWFYLQTRVKSADAKCNLHIEINSLTDVRVRIDACFDHVEVSSLL
jgi:hypothetical protein